VHSTVKELGGGIVVESERGKGTTFRIVLPADIDAHEDTESYEDDSAPVRGNGEKVLIIDDEYAVRNVLGLSLSHLGYAVETACSGLEGVEKYAEAKGSFDLVILDMLMPGLSGEEVFARIREMNPTCRVLLVSGFSSEHVVSKILEQGGMDFIQKPFLIEVLSRKVRGCLCD
jgi:DNA-binding NtrC family response regulator